MARNNLINESRNKYFSNNRNNLIMSERYFVPNNSCFNFSIQKKRKRIPNSKSFTDYWSCRYDMEKENDRAYFLQKQNISHMKNLIDETLRLRKKSKFPQHDIYAAVQEEKILNKKKILQRKDQAIKEKEKMNQIFEQISKKQKEDEFNKECKLHREIENMKEKSQTKFQKDLLMRQRLWEKQHFEHQKKVEQMHKKKHEMAVEEYMQILKKGIERYEKIDERKNEMSMKYQRKNEERNIYLINYKIKNRIIEKNLREKFERKHRNISKFYFIQKEIRKDVIYKQRKEREYNNFNNYNNRLLNKSMENNRRKRLLDLFEKNEDNIEKNRIYKQSQNEEYKFNNMVKSDEIYDNYIRKQNLLNNKNKIKLRKMMNKDIDIYNKILRRQNSAQDRITRFDKIKLNKDIMMKNVKEALEEQKDYRPQDIYNKVFTYDEYQMLNDF
jgi:hypothetical protein